MQAKNRRESYTDCPKCGGYGERVYTGGCTTCDTPPEFVEPCSFCNGTGVVPTCVAEEYYEEKRWK